MAYLLQRELCVICYICTLKAVVSHIPAAASKTDERVLKGSLSSQHDPTAHNWTHTQNWGVHQAITKIQTSAGLAGLIATLSPSTRIAPGSAGGKHEAELLSHTLLLSLMALLLLLPSCWVRDSLRPCSNQGGPGSRETLSECKHCTELVMTAQRSNLFPSCSVTS